MTWGALVGVSGTGTTSVSQRSHTQRSNHDPYPPQETQQSATLPCDMDFSVGQHSFPLPRPPGLYLLGRCTVLVLTARGARQNS